MKGRDWTYVGKANARVDGVVHMKRLQFSLWRFFRYRLFRRPHFAMHARAPLLPDEVNKALPQRLVQMRCLLARAEKFGKVTDYTVQGLGLQLTERRDRIPVWNAASRSKQEQHSMSNEDYTDGTVRQGVKTEETTRPRFHTRVAQRDEHPSP